MTDDPILSRFRCKNAYSEGFHAGMKEGERKGFKEGHDGGFYTAKKLYENQDYREGYEQGYEEGKRDALAWLDDDDLTERIKMAVIKEFKEYHGIRNNGDKE